MMAARITPTNIAIVGNEMAIAWSDGGESYLGFETLRRACPCAACAGEPDALGRVDRPEVRFTESSFELGGWHIVGGYAVQFTWGDGHGTGLYTFDYLRRLSSAGG